MNQNVIDPLKIQQIDLPPSILPVIIIGAGGIVNDAHLPAYQKRGIPVNGIYDRDPGRSRQTAEKWSIPTVFPSLEVALNTSGHLVDLAVPPSEVISILEKMRDGSAVLIQKPMGENFNHATAIADLAQKKQLKAAINFQFKFSPLILAIRDLIAKGALGQITDIEFNLNIYTPWNLFPFLEKMDRVEIQVHSVHYLDAIRALIGLPQGVYAQTLPDPRFPKLKSTRSSILLNYGDSIRCLLSINHNYAHSKADQRAMIKVEGTEGAAIGQMGICLNYPQGEKDKLTLHSKSGHTEEILLIGDWFPDAFGNSMAALQRWIACPSSPLEHSIERSLETMGIVEACYRSNQSGGTPLP